MFNTIKHDIEGSGTVSTGTLNSPRDTRGLPVIGVGVGIYAKAEVLGIPITQAPQFFALRKTCSNCGDKKEELSLVERQYHCHVRGFTEHRDINATINLKYLAAGHAESQNACGV